MQLCFGTEIDTAERKTISILITIIVKIVILKVQATSKLYAFDSSALHADKNRRFLFQFSSNRSRFGIGQDALLHQEVKKRVVGGCEARGCAECGRQSGQLC